MFVRATVLDPSYARAYAGIADCDTFLYLRTTEQISFEAILAMSDKALALGRALATAEAEAERAAARLDEERLELWRGMLRKAFEAADVPVPVDALRELAACAAEGRQLEVSEEVARASRDAVRLRVGGELRLEIEAEFAEREADEANEHGDKLAENGSAPPEPYVASALAIREPARADHGGGEIGWEDVRQEFRKRYVQREQAIVAEAETREREQRERERQDAGLGGGGRRVRWHAEAFGAGRHR